MASHNDSSFSFVDDDHVWYLSLKIIGLCALVVIVILIYVYAWCDIYGHQTREVAQPSINGVSPALQGVQSRRPPPINRVLHRSVIASLPTFVYKATQQLHSSIDTLECAVCLSNLEEGNMTKLIPACKHMFHLRCINIWLSSHSTCPICRSAVQASRIDDASSETSKEDAYMTTLDGLQTDGVQR